MLSWRRTPEWVSPGSGAAGLSLPSRGDRTAALSPLQLLAAAACVALQRGTGNRYCTSASINRLVNHPSSSPGRGQELVIIIICHFQPEPSFQRAIFPTLKSQSNPVAFTVSCSAQAKVAQDSPCLLQTLLAAMGNHNRAL